MNGVEKEMPNTIIENLFKELESSKDFRKNGDYAELRRDAFKKYQESGFPGLKNEEYKYTPIVKKVTPQLYINDANNVHPDQDYLKKQIPYSQNSVNIFFINGILSNELSDLKHLPTEITIEPLESAYKKERINLSRYFHQESEFNKDPFIPLNTSLSQNGLYIKSVEETISENSINIVHYTETENPGLFINNHHIIIAGKGSKIKLTEYFLSKNGQTYFDNTCTSIFVESGSILNYNIIQLMGDQAIHVGTSEIHQEKDSKVNSFTITLSGGMIRNNLNIRLNASNCESHLYGLFYLKGKDHADNHTIVDHRKPHCFSTEFYKGILDDESKGVFNGKIYVQPQAQKTNAYQSNKNIILSEHASINTKPQLEIRADDVKCTHGTSTGKIDEEQLFYLKSRGLDDQSARGLLTFAFANDLIEKIEDKELEIYIINKIQERLNLITHAG